MISEVRRVVRLTALLVLAAAGVASAQPAPPVTVPTPEGDVTVTADHMEEIGPERLLVGTGNVELVRGRTRLLADRVEMNRQTGDAVATGHVVFYDAETRMSGDRLDYNLRTGTGVLYDGQTHAAPYYRVAGQRLERVGENVYHVQRGSFTTCEDDPPAWSFRFGEATADFDTWLHARNGSFWIRNFPLVPWLPFVAAAIRRERQTGFLFPKFGQSSSKGFQFELPFFWAISDSQDATVGVVEYTKRGTGFDLDYRYFLSAQNHGEVAGFWLKETEVKNADRGWLSIRHDWLIRPDLSITADVRTVTDDELFRDYGDGLHQRSEQRAESNVFVARTWPTWDLVGDLFWYQDLTTDRPVELDRLPDITLQGSRQPVPGLPGVLYEFEGSATRFVRELGSDGSRLDLHPRLSRPIDVDGLFTVTPFAGGRLTAYDRRVRGTRVSEGQLVEETEPDEKFRRLVEAGSDLEATASRVYPMGGRFNLDSLLHTIEPRIRYTWISGRDKNELPSWTDLDNIRSHSLFEYSLTNRVRGKTVVSDPTGTPQRLEMVRFVVGHSIDLKDPRGMSGDVFGQLILRPTTYIDFRGDLRQDTHGGGLSNASADVSLSLRRLLASVGTRYSDTQNVNFVQAAVTADITRNLTARASTNWDLRTDRFLENRFAVDLRFQCWAVTVEVVDRNGAGAAGESEVRFAVTLLGLGAPITTSMGLGSLTSAGGTSR